MKKLLLPLSVFLSILFLAACGQTAAEPAEDTDDVHYHATLVVTVDGKEDKKTVDFEQGDSVMDVLEDYHEVEEEGGMVTAINGVSQDPAAKTYWMYKVNDKMAEVGAEDLEVQEGDTIEFYMETFQ